MSQIENCPRFLQGKTEGVLIAFTISVVMLKLQYKTGIGYDLQV